MTRGVAPDGSPVEIYLAIPPGDTPELIHDAMRPGGTILELGSGPGRITHPLVELGHEVVAVDDSAEMLHQVHGAETVEADIFGLDLDRRFDAVVAASHFINDADRHRRAQLLEVCRRHVRPDGVVLLERYASEWANDPQPSTGKIGDVEVVFEPLEVRESDFTARATYVLGDKTWEQLFTAASVTDDMLTGEAARAGLALVGWLDEQRTWARLQQVFDAMRS